MKEFCLFDFNMESISNERIELKSPIIEMMNALVNNSLGICPNQIIVEMFDDLLINRESE